jgi:capsular polysaccharide biosynthesis protein
MIFTRVFMAVFLLICITSTIVTFILPEAYASTARVSVDADKSGECKVIQSEAVLWQVIDKLDLNAVWGRKYNGGNILNATNVFQLLKNRMAVLPERNTSLIDITVFSEDKNEAAQIANAIADSYRNHSFSADKPATSAPKIEIVDSAKPGLAPVRPNKPLNISVGVLAGIVLGFIAGKVAAGLASISRDAKPPKPGLAKF